MDVTFEGSTSRGNEQWLTPPHLLKALGKFDLDPCSPIDRPWPTASEHYTIRDNGLEKPWNGSVFCNPPYGRQAAAWLEKCARHGNAIALLFARTDTKMFFDHIWDTADALFFIKGRLRFHYLDGRVGNNAGAPSVLVAYGKSPLERLQHIDLPGKLIRLT